MLNLVTLTGATYNLAHYINMPRNIKNQNPSIIFASEDRVKRSSLLQAKS
jgi:hypothetical protein